MSRSCTRQWLSLLALVLLFALPGFAKTFSERAGAYNISFSIRPFPVIVGDHQARIQLSGPDGKPITQAQVSVQTDMPGMPMGVRPFPLAETSPGVYEGSVTLSMQGLWNLVLRVNGSQGEGRVEFQMETGKGEIPSWLLWPAILLLIGLLVWILWRFADLIFSRKVFVPLVLLTGISLVVFLSTRLFLKKQNSNPMGMKMEMNAPNMGMSARLFSAPKPVAVETVKRQSLDQTVTATGVVVPALEEVVYPRVIGWLSKLSLYPGDRVEKGEEITRLDWGELTGTDREIHGGMRNAPHDIAVLELESQASREKEKQALDELRKAQADLAYWQKEFPREAFLLKQGAISKEEYDKEKSQYQSALWEMHAKEKARQVSSKETEIAAHALLTIQDYRVLRAHISGVVTERMVNEGVLVQPGTPILKIAKIDQVRVQADVAEADLSQISVGTPVMIHSPKLPGKTINAHITSVFHQVDPGSRTGKVEAYIPNPKQKLFPGDFVDVDFAVAHRKEILAVPKRALVPYEGGFVVWVVQDGLAERRKVIPGITNGERIEIRSGLKPGDKVIFAGQEDLIPDQPVKEAAWGSGPLQGTLLLNQNEEEGP